MDFKVLIKTVLFLMKLTHVAMIYLVQCLNYIKKLIHVDEMFVDSEVNTCSGSHRRTTTHCGKKCRVCWTRTKRI